MDTPIETTRKTPLLGGLSPVEFMRRHWHKKPLLVRGAVPAARPLVSRAQLFALAGADEVESRLVTHREGRWSMRHGPLKRSALPPLRQARWTLLVQGLDLHVPAARALLDRFRFAPDARLDDLMLSYATDGGGVGPHVDSYDVFLLQVQGRRRWRIGPLGTASDGTLLPDAPLKVLADFRPTHDWLLEPGDMLYLPPGWAHDGAAEGECMTASIGFRAPGRRELARDVLQRMLDAAADDGAGALYRDPKQAATSEPARIPSALQAHAADAVARWLADASFTCALGEVLSEPKRGVWFDPTERDAGGTSQAVVLDLRTRMLYDDRHVFINGESFRAAGRDARLMRRLADRRGLAASEIAALGSQARALLGEWLTAGWLQIDGGTPTEGDDA